jgi:hypothetical protein
MVTLPRFDLAEFENDDSAIRSRLADLAWPAVHHGVHLDPTMISAMIPVMPMVPFSTNIPEHARDVLRARASHDGVSYGEWLARAIYDKATRDAAREPMDEAAADSEHFLTVAAAAREAVGGAGGRSAA